MKEMHLSTGIQQFKITIYYNAVKPKAEATITADQIHYFFENIILHCVSQIVTARSASEVTTLWRCTNLFIIIIIIIISDFLDSKCMAYDDRAPLGPTVGGGAYPRPIAGFII